MSRKISRAVLIFLPLVLAGCASISPMEAIEQSRDDALERHDLVLSEGADLSDARGAVSVGFHHNRNLAADLMEAGLAASRWQAASRPANPIVEFVTKPDEQHGRFYDIDLMASVMGIAATPWRARAARAEFEQAQSAAILRAVDYAAEVESFWVAAIAAKQRLDLQQRSLQAAEAALLVAAEIRAAGNTAEIELVRERAFVLQVRAAERSARLDLEAARFALAQSLGTDVELDDLPDRMPALRDAPAPTDRADVISASLALDASRAEVEATARRAGLENWASLLDHVELGLVWEREDREWKRGWAAELSLPVFDQGQARRSQARLEAEQAVARHAARTEHIDAMLRNAQAVRALALEQWMAAENDGLPASAELLDQTLLHYNAMQVGVFELLQAFESRIEAGQAWVNAQEMAHRADIRLRQLRAGGSPGEAPVMQDMAAAGRDPGGH